MYFGFKWGFIPNIIIFVISTGMVNPTILVYAVSDLNSDEVCGFHDLSPCSQVSEQHMEYLKALALR